MKDEMRFTVLHVNGINVPISDDGKLVSLYPAIQAVRPAAYMANNNLINKVLREYSEIETVRVHRRRLGTPEITCIEAEAFSYLADCLVERFPNKVEQEAVREILEEMELRAQSPFTEEEHAEIAQKQLKDALLGLEDGENYTGILLEYPFTKGSYNLSLQVLVSKGGGMFLPSSRLLLLLGILSEYLSRSLPQTNGKKFKPAKLSKKVECLPFRDMIEGMSTCGMSTTCFPLQSIPKLFSNLRKWSSVERHPEQLEAMDWFESNVLPTLINTKASDLPLTQFVHGMTSELTTKSLCDACDQVKVVEVVEVVTTLEPQAKRNKKNILHLVNPVTKASADYVPPKAGAFSLPEMENGVLSIMPKTSALSEEGYLAVTRALNRAQEVAAAFGVPKEAIGPNLIRAVEEQTGVDLSWLRNPKAEVRMINFGAQDPFAHVHAKLDASQA